MIKKDTLNSIIKKYNLNDLVENAKWCIKDKSVFISFLSTETKSLVGTRSCPNIDIKDIEVGIYDTSKLLKLLKIMDHNIEIDVYSEMNTPIKLLLSDNQYDLEFYCCFL